MLIIRTLPVKGSCCYRINYQSANNVFGNTNVIKLLPNITVILNVSNVMFQYELYLEYK